MILPREVVNRLKTGEGQSLSLFDAPDGSYRLTSYDPVFEAKIMKAEDIIGRYRNTLKALAE